MRGGLGFRNFRYTNAALLAKTAWLLIHSPDELWVKILKCKYFKNCHPLHHKDTKESSWVWKSICHGLHIIMNNSIWEVRNGVNIHAFLDNWIPNMVSPLCLTYPNPNLCVHSFIDNDTKTWNTDLVKAYSPKTIVRKF